MNMQTMRELTDDELEVVSGGQTIVGGSVSLIDVDAVSEAVNGVITTVGIKADNALAQLGF